MSARYLGYHGTAVSYHSLSGGLWESPLTKSATMP